MWLGNAYDPVVWAMRFCPVPLFLLGVKFINHKKLPLLWFGQEGQLTVNRVFFNDFQVTPDIIQLLSKSLIEFLWHFLYIVW
jgi:hypothetical protein